MGKRARETGRTNRRPGHVRILGLRVDRLTLQLAVGIALLVIVPLAVGLGLMSGRHYDQAIETRRKAADFQNRVLEAALRHQMVEKDPALMATILEEVGSQREIERVMILNHAGEVRVSSAPELVGTAFSRDSGACLVCHANQPAERDRSALLDTDERATLRSVLPIANRAECHQCHGSENRLNGILIMDTSLAEVQAALRRDLSEIFVGAGLVALLLLTGVGLLIRHLLIRRLNRLGRTARAIAAGNLRERAVADGNDVIRSLADDFNSMADAVSRLVTEVREQEAQLTSVMSSLDDGLVVLDRGLRVVACNRSFARRLDATPEALQGRRCGDVSPGALPCRTSGPDCPVTRCLATGEVQRAVFIAEEEDDGGMRVEEVYASPVKSADGSIVQVVEIWRDISERVREEERLAEIERMSSLGVLASGFSHEVNTPLASMLTCAEATLRRIDESLEGSEGADGSALLEEVRDHADTIRRQALRCRAITAQFLRFSRGIPPSTELLDLRAKVAEVVSLVRPTAEEARVTLELDGGEDVPPVTANSEVVQHVVLNLLVNAIQSCERRGGRVRMRFLVDSDVRLEVRDDGCGISREQQRHLFAPLRSSKPEGTGLGLFLSRSFMRRFGGDVRLVESEVDEGSCFQVVFVRADGAGR